MGRLRKVAIIALVLAGVAYGGLRVWVYHKYKGGIDQAVTLLSPFVAIHYAGITSSLDGSVGLRDLTVTPRSTGENFHVEAVVVHFPSVWYLIHGGDALQRGQLPRQVGISVHGLRIDLDGEAMRRFGEFLQTRADHNAGGDVGCGDVRFIGPEQLQAMGYHDLTLDVDAGYRFVAGEQGVRIHMRMTARHMWQTDAHGVLEGPTRSIASVLPGSRPLLQSMTVDYRDESYVSRLVKYCAGQSGRSRAATIDALAGPHPDRGIMPGAGWVAARKAMLTHPGTMRLTLAPQSPIALDSLAAYQPQDVVRLLNVKLSVNGKAITAPLVTGTAPSAPAGPSSPSAVRAARSAAPVWRVVGVERLGSLIGHPVRVHTNDGRVRGGRLAALRGDKVLVSRNLYGGTMTVSVPRSDIRKVEVLVAGQ